jgi:importin subunit beta-1
MFRWRWKLLSLAGELSNDEKPPESRRLAGLILKNGNGNGNGWLPSSTRQATFKTLGYICEEVSLNVLDRDHVNKIIIAVDQAMKSAEENNDVRLAAIQALYNALGVAKETFINDIHRNDIMKIICEATLFPELKIRRVAFECLVAISMTYYEYLASYIQDIFNITARAVREDRRR